MRRGGNLRELADSRSRGAGDGAKLGRVLTYALVTPARDEADNLRRLAGSVLAQTVRPSAWVVVDDGSTDGTSDFLERLGRDHDWIRIIPSPGATTHAGTLAVGRRAGRDIVAFNAGVAAIEEVPGVLVKLDADVSFAADFFERILRELDADPRLGITGGECYELEGGEWRLQPVTGSHVRGATRSYRWECWKDVRPLEERLGWDGIDHLKAEERGWKVRSVTGLPFHHHRPLGERDGFALARWARVGNAAYYMGYRFPYLVLRSLHRGRRDPGAVAIVWGYLAACARREERYPDAAVRRRLRERQRLRHLHRRAREASGPRRALPTAAAENRRSEPMEPGTAVDVVVVSYNSQATLRDCLEPFAHMRDVAVYVVDNDSRDGSLGTIADLPVHTIVRRENGGFAAGCNDGWRAGSAPFVLFLNPDASLGEESLRELVRALEADARIGIAGPRLLAADGSVQLSQRRFPALRSTFAQAVFLHRVFPRAAWSDEVVRDHAAYDAGGSPDWLSGACLLVRRDVLERIGGWDDSFFLYSEDTDLCRRGRNAGFDVRYVPTATAVHAGGQSSPRAGLLPVLAESRVRYARKHETRMRAFCQCVGVSLSALSHLAVARTRGTRAGHARALRNTLLRV